MHSLFLLHKMVKDVGTTKLRHIWKQKVRLSHPAQPFLDRVNSNFPHSSTAKQIWLIGLFLNFFLMAKV
jgi:hypothetical protein